mgnify:CR=1 FL=1
MQEEEYGRQPALTSAVRERLDGLLLETIIRIWEDLAGLVLPLREVYHRASPRVQAFALIACIREAVRQHWPVLLRDPARTPIEAREIAMWAYVDVILEPVRRGMTPAAALEQLWLTLNERIKTERALELGYEVGPTRDLEELTRCMRKVVDREARQHKARSQKCRKDYDELEEETGGGLENYVDQREVPIRARMEVVSRNDRERAYIAFLATGFGQSEAARRAGLTPGEARAFRDRARHNGEPSRSL